MLASAATLPLLGLGFVLGLKHALEGDHIVAVSTVVTENRGVMRTSLVGTFWGIGHTVSLLLVAVLVLAFEVTLSPKFAILAESVVALMLIILGADLLRKVGVAGISSVSVHSVKESKSCARKPFLIGVVHGLAGSAALMLMVVATMPSTFHGLVYVAVFGLGTIGGMCVMSFLMGLPLALGGQRVETFGENIKIVAGLLSIGFGIVLGWSISRSSGFLS
ncbi:MAG TPA: hypothetical protein EYN18_07175 [Nitrospirales bacterium]|nr:hypothetical protein [Nitrospirales bacterium]